MESNSNSYSINGSGAGLFAEDEEAVELVNVIGPRSTRLPKPSIVRIRPASGNKKSRRLRLLGLCCLIFVVVIAVVGSMDSTDDDVEITEYRFPMSCPTPDKELEQFKNDEIVQNITGFLNTFRTSNNNHDFKDQSYLEAKEKIRSYKAQKFASLKNGDAIFESGCGIGLNLVMTLEILQETYNVTELSVHGNDIDLRSVVIANLLMDNGMLPAAGHKGTICQSDSIAIYFAESDQFDLVFTSYLTPLRNPLNTPNKKPGQMYDYYEGICNGTNPGYKSLLDIWRSRQEGWVTRWVSEMIRIAKPGAPIIIEQASTFHCNNRHDADGVLKEYWDRQVRNQIWPVEPNSLEIIPFDDMRYSVFLKKAL